MNSKETDKNESEQSPKNDSSWDSPSGGSYFVEEDGSLTRIGDVPEEVRKEAERTGRKLRPDTIPADKANDL